MIRYYLAQQEHAIRFNEGKDLAEYGQVFERDRKPDAISAPGWVDSVAVKQSLACLLVQWLSLHGGLGLGT